MAFSIGWQGYKVLMLRVAVVLPSCLATMACRMFVPALERDQGLHPQRGRRKAGIIDRVGFMQSDTKASNFKLRCCWATSTQ